MVIHFTSSYIPCFFHEVYLYPHNNCIIATMVLHSFIKTKHSIIAINRFHIYLYSIYMFLYTLGSFLNHAFVSQELFNCTTAKGFTFLYRNYKHSFIAINRFHTYLYSIYMFLYTLGSFLNHAFVSQETFNCTTAKPLGNFNPQYVSDIFNFKL